MELNFTTREFCQSCNRVSPVGFHSPKWAEVAGRWRDSILCIMCFAALGDEKNIQWERDIQLHPVSLRTHRVLQAERIRLINQKEAAAWSNPPEPDQVGEPG